MLCDSQALRACLCLTGSSFTRVRNMQRHDARVDCFSHGTRQPVIYM